MCVCVCFAFRLNLKISCLWFFWFGGNADVRVINGFLKIGQRPSWFKFFSLVFTLHFSTEICKDGRNIASFGAKLRMYVLKSTIQYLKLPCFNSSAQCWRPFYTIMSYWSSCLTNITFPQVNFPDVEKVEWLNKVCLSDMLDMCSCVFSCQELVSLRCTPYDDGLLCFI